MKMSEIKMAEYPKEAHTAIPQTQTVSPMEHSQPSFPPVELEAKNDQVAMSNTHTAGPAPERTLPSNMIQPEYVRSQTHQQDKAANLTDLRGPPPPVDHFADGKTPAGLQVNPESAPAMVTPLDRLGELPAWIDCPFCKQRTKTMVTKEGEGMQMFVHFPFSRSRAAPVPKRSSFACHFNLSRFETN